MFLALLRPPPPPLLLLLLLDVSHSRFLFMAPLSSVYILMSNSHQNIDVIIHKNPPLSSLALVSKVFKPAWFEFWVLSYNRIGWVNFYLKKIQNSVILVKINK